MQPVPFEYAIIEETDLHTFQDHINDLAKMGYALGQVLHNTFLTDDMDGVPVLNHSYVAVMGQKEGKYEVVK